MFLAIGDPRCSFEEPVVFRSAGDQAESTVLVWTYRIDLDAEEVGAMASTLSMDELERARRFRFDNDRRRFVAVRAKLRSVLGAYFNMKPANVRFRYASHGKPAVDRGTNCAVFFNVSHSDDVALIALTQRGEVGVDIERVRPVPGLEGIVTRFFSDRERAAILHGSNEPLQTFFYYWTLKEAWLKGVGVGLSASIDGIELSHGPNAVPRIQAVAPGSSVHLQWLLHSWSPVPGFLAAFAVDSH